MENMLEVILGKNPTSTTHKTCNQSTVRTRLLWKYHLGALLAFEDIKWKVFLMFIHMLMFNLTNKFILVSKTEIELRVGSLRWISRTGFSDLNVHGHQLGNEHMQIRIQ